MYPISRMVHIKSSLKPAHDQFSHFCTVHSCTQHTDTWRDHVTCNTGGNVSRHPALLAMPVMCANKPTWSSASKTFAVCFTALSYIPPSVTINCIQKVSIMYHHISHTVSWAHVGKKVKFSHARYRALGPELITVYRQSACRWLSHPTGGRLPLLSARPAVTFPAEERHRPSASTKLYCLVTTCPRLLLEARRLGLILATDALATRLSSHSRGPQWVFP